MMAKTQDTIGRDRRRAIAAVAVAAAIAAVTTTPAHAERFVVVNGQRMNLAEIAYWEQRNCGPIANGAYWFNSSNGMWGYAGNPNPQGILGDNCHQQRRPSLSERGMLYSPHDWVR